MEGSVSESNSYSATLEFLPPEIQARTRISC